MRCGQELRYKDGLNGVDNWKLIAQWNALRIENRCLMVIVRIEGECDKKLDGDDS